MGLADALRAGVKAADTALKDVQGTITYYRYLSSDAYGAKTYAGAVSLQATIDLEPKQHWTGEGILAPVQASLTFLDAAALATATNGAGISVNDKIVLPNGESGPILKVPGYMDPSTLLPVATEVLIGRYQRD